MLQILSQFSEQATLYSTLAGKVWYILVYIFRVIVVVSVGNAVYNDEQDQFKCSTHVVGCENVCYDQFAKISHMRFWAFQLLAINTPVVFFHFYALYEQGQHENRVISTKSCSRPAGNNDNWSFDCEGKTEYINGEPFRLKLVHTEQGKKEIVLTRNIKRAYFITSFLRALIELGFLSLSYIMFSYPKHTMHHLQYTYTGGSAIWPEVPQLYRCRGGNVNFACGQHMLPGTITGFVPCWVSRPWEKTIFLRYMNCLSALCFLLAFIEVFYLAIKSSKSKKRLPSKTRSGRLAKMRESNPKLAALKAALALHVQNETKPTTSSNKQKSRKHSKLLKKKKVKSK